MTLVAATVVLGGWLAVRGNEIKTELSSAEELIPSLKAQVATQDYAGANSTLNIIAAHTDNARGGTQDPIWKIASTIPYAGANFTVVTELAVAIDEVADGTLKPLLEVADSLKWDALGPVNGKLNVEPIRAAAPSVLEATNTLDLTYNRLRAIDDASLLPQVAEPFARTTAELGELNRTLGTVADATALLPSMIGSDEPRDYLVLVQNSAEVRATGGLPGALALLRVNNGTLELVKQSSGSAMGKNDPPLTVEEEQLAIYSSRLGRYISDVNLTPDFPTAASSAKAMWEARYGGNIDGVLAIDPVVLAHLLEASGPITVAADSPAAVIDGLPRTLTSKNVVPTLLSDVYQVLNTNDMQDAYFAVASQEIFKAITSGAIEGPALLKAIVQSNEENRLRLWSAHKEDQDILKGISLGGSVSGPSAGGASFGVYFNDGTGAKMDYYVKRTVQLTKMCPADGYVAYKVQIKLENTAPVDAGEVLPAAVTGGGKFGTPAGTVQTNVVVYGPAQSLVDATTQDGSSISFGSYLHAGRPVGVVTTRLAPGASTEVDMAFVKVVQDNPPALVVTPTVQSVKDVTMPTQMEQCEE